MMSNLLERSDRTEVTLERSRYVGTCIHGADDELKVKIEFYVNEETLSDGVHVCVTPECVCGVPVNECCEPTLQHRYVLPRPKCVWVLTWWSRM